MNISFEHCLILSGQKGLYLVETPEGLLQCRAAARIRKEGVRLMAGDRVSVEDNGDGTGFVRSAEQRANSLVRPPVANVELLVIVASAELPKTLPFNIDKLTVIAEKQGIPVAVAVTKSELDGAGADALLGIYRKTPYPAFRIAEKGKEGAEPLRELMQGKLSVFCGASGVGKSTLLNSLFPSLHAEVGALSKKIGRGKNTTRTTSLFCVSENTYVADTPGFTMLDPPAYCRLDRRELFTLFPEMVPFAADCRYSHCTHLCEEGCGIVGAVREGHIRPERHESFRRLYDELKTLEKSQGSVSISKKRP